jgi:fructokinase
VPHDRILDPFDGVCPYHGDCLEGLASGPALQARCGEAAEALPPDHPIWMLEAGYLAYACVNCIYTLSPQRVVFGGGVMQRHLFPLVRDRVRSLLNGYPELSGLRQDLEDYIVPAGLGARAGVLGALALAARENAKSLPV